ncbi:hypothetical protein MPDQ_007996 [Monascus purpureus]|uniref:Uncharacterized protein n=1 Tax=Monascus purpureus TaxID=5098 RepID=A0A507QR09_MONPU|nr:hypothetical protein MPDQ_007996 [Monascus purpureus]
MKFSIFTILTSLSCALALPTTNVTQKPDNPPSDPSLKLSNTTVPLSNSSINDTSPSGPSIYLPRRTYRRRQLNFFQPGSSSSSGAAFPAGDFPVPSSSLSLFPSAFPTSSMPSSSLPSGVPGVGSGHGKRSSYVCATLEMKNNPAVQFGDRNQERRQAAVRPIVSEVLANETLQLLLEKLESEEATRERNECLVRIYEDASDCANDMFAYPIWPRLLRFDDLGVFSTTVLTR